MIFNINDHVRVKLTEHGKEILKSNFEKLFENHPSPPEYIPRYEDENGWSEWQLWDLMHEFGSHIYQGSKNCFDLSIEIEESDKTEFPPILDACCGGRQFWFDKENPDVLFADCRVMEPTIVGSGKDARVRKCLPDVVHDFRHMEYPDNTFEMVVFDPPHLFLGENSYMAKSYGTLDKKTWRDDLTKGFSECFRVLKLNGILIFKWNECDIPLSNILKCTTYKPLFGHPSGKAQKTHWVAFRKTN